MDTVGVLREVSAGASRLVEPGKYKIALLSVTDLEQGIFDN